MIPSPRYILIWLALLSPLAAQVPTKPPLSRYSSLWQNSPFTSKPEPEKLAERPNPLEDFTLTGIAPVPGGYRITIVSKKNREIKKVIEPGRDSEFKVVSVDRNPDISLGTTVTLTDGRVRGTVQFEPDLVTLNTPPVAPQPPNPQLPPGVNPPTPGAQPNTTRQPRPRIVPPPAAAKENAPATPNNNNRRGRNPRSN